jgi:hypothetical protein
MASIATTNVRDIIAAARPGTVFKSTASVAITVYAIDTTAQSRRNRTRRKDTRQRFPFSIVVIVIVVIIIVDVLLFYLLLSTIFVMNARRRRWLRISSSLQWTSGVK